MTKGGPGDSSTTLATWSYRLGFGTLLPAVRARRRGRQPAHRHRRSSSASSTSGCSEGRSSVMTDPTRTRSADRRSGVASLTAVMLFPVYWMINVSLTPTERHAQDPAELVPAARRPSTATARSCTSSCPTSAPACVIGLGTVVLTVVIAAPAGYSLAKLRPRGGGALELRAADRADDPRHHHGDGLLRHLHQPRHAQPLVGTDHRRLHPRRAVRRADLHRVHVRHSRRTHAGSADRRRRHRAHLLSDRAAGQPQRRRHGLAVRVPVGLVGLRLRLHAGQRRRSRSRSPSASTTTSATTTRSGTPSWPPPSSPRSQRLSC